MSQSPLDPGTTLSDSLRYQQGWKALNRLLHEDRSFSGNERNCAFLNCGGRSFADMSGATGFDFPDDARAVTATDWDFDGDLDVWLTCRTAPRVRLLENRATPGHWVALQLAGDGKRVNRDAIGARAEVWLEGVAVPLSRTVFGGDSFLSQSSSWLHFGLGEGAKLAKVVVHWPGQETTEITGVAGNGFYQISMGDPTARRWMPPTAIRPLVAAPQTPLRDEESARLILPARLPLPVLAGLEDAKGPLLVNLWSATCKTCNNELTEWAREWKTLEAAGLRVLALNADEQAPAPRDYPFPTAHAAPATLRGLDLFQRSALDRWMPLPVPTSFLLDRGGNVAAIYKGRVSPEQLVADVKLLDAPPEAWRIAALPFPGVFLNAPPTPAPGRLATQFIDADQPADALRYLTDYAARHKVGSDVTSAIAALRATLPDPGADLLAKADALRDKGDARAAVAAYKETLSQSPKTIAAAEHLAWILASHPDVTLRSPAEARLLGDRLCQLTNRKNPAALDLLATAQAACGDFPTAIKTAGEALSLLGESPAATPVRERLAQFLAGKAWTAPGG